jgi:hypothetical protein
VTQNGSEATDPLEPLLLEVTMDETATAVLADLLTAAEPYPWKVLEIDDECVVMTSAGDALATLPNDSDGRKHAALMAAAPLLALRVLNSGWVKT